MQSQFFFFPNLSAILPTGTTEHSQMRNKMTQIGTQASQGITEFSLPNPIFRYAVSTLNNSILCSRSTHSKNNLKVTLTSCGIHAKYSVVHGAKWNL